MADIHAKRDGRSVAIESKRNSLAEIRRQTAVMVEEVMAATPDTYEDGDFMFQQGGIQ